MASSEAAETKNIITGLLVSTPLKCTIQHLCKDFLDTVGYKIPFQRLGFKSVEEYLRSIPDTVRIYGSGSSAQVEAVIKPKSAHINDLVAKQKKSSIPSHKKKYVKQFRNYQPSTSTYQQQSSFSRPSSSQIPRLGPKNCNKLNGRYSENKTLNNLDCESLNNSGSEQNSPVSLSTSVLLQQKPSSCLSNSSYQEKYEECYKNREKDYETSSSLDYDEYETKIPPSIQNNLRKLIIKFPGGIDCSRVPAEYQKMFNKKLSYEKFNYRSVIEMCSDLPEIFHYVQSSSDDFILYDKNRPVPCLNQNDVATATTTTNNENIGGDVFSEFSKVDWSKSVHLVPSDVLHLSDRIPRYFPKDIQEGDYLDVSMGEIYDISKFWIYLTFGELSSLMDDLQIFFNSQRNKYLIPEFLLSEGLYCTTLYAGKYHRCVIVDLLVALPGCVRVCCIISKKN